MGKNTVLSTFRMIRIMQSKTRSFVGRRARLCLVDYCLIAVIFIAQSWKILGEILHVPWSNS